MGQNNNYTQIESSASVKMHVSINWGLGRRSRQSSRASQWNPAVRKGSRTAPNCPPTTSCCSLQIAMQGRAGRTPCWANTWELSTDVCRWIKSTLEERLKERTYQLREVTMLALKSVYWYLQVDQEHVVGTPEKRALVFAGDQEHTVGTPEKVCVDVCGWIKSTLCEHVKMCALKCADDQQHISGTPEG